MAQGLFIGLPEGELLSLRKTAMRNIGLVVTSHSDSGSSVGKSFGMPAQDMLAEANFALKKLDPSRYGKAKTVIEKTWDTR